MNKEILFWEDKKTSEKISNMLQSGGIIVGTSDTILGFLAEATENGALMLNRIKGRSSKPYIILIGEKSRVKYFSDEVTPAVQALIDVCWPGPLTIIVKAKLGLPKSMQGADGTVALRVPAHKGLLSLLESIPAVFSTSANKSGMPVPLSIAELDPAILEEVSFIVDDVQGESLPISKPSTIIDCTEPQPRVIREGAYAIDLLEQIVGQKFLDY